ncbi:5-formyltetrahydrofolate cyclo-ligase [Halogeometricum pallidum JCM 14848]|uniref:5-formyltetrahydrofolate cyclo-ligase n=1 Tax=Halogeometricum pallidum JCM 14848 TaxID=1227487 RepID=M0DH11_HALPD|nr:5-formyltetrahydrofolate cyclo-ligase [Halogeometricum pallidum]ELZ34073.1 5-formyltetrahydrofolate cyclo-ligase [Halogeometricum pallidum JCM 14848]
MEKQELRERVWDELEESGEARFPYPPHGRIPNFNGADEAAERLAANEAWQEADVIKSNPDSPQLPVRRAALRQGKTVYMAVPRLRDEKCFLRLDPAEIEDIDHATTIGGSSEVGVQVGPDEMEPIDLIVSGSVAVNDEGARVGKGEGYSDLEFAVLREFGLVDDETTTVTTLHETQFVDEVIPTTPQDVPIQRVCTPKRDVRTDAPSEKPSGIAWGVLTEERMNEIPILNRLKR